MITPSLRNVRSTTDRVVVVGTLSLLDSAAFPRATVWSAFGMGYLFIPLVLPILGLLFLRSQHDR